MDAQACEDIRRLLARYNLAIDLGDAEGWVACFTDDGVFRCTGLADDSPLGGTYRGRDELAAYARTHYGIMRGRARHWNANLLIEGDGDDATMTCYLLALTTGSSVRGSTGIYRDRLRRRDGAWLFAERHVEIDAPPV
jgi:ketosteroid isomerase-like protein